MRCMHPTEFTRPVRRIDRSSYRMGINGERPAAVPLNRRGRRVGRPLIRIADMMKRASTGLGSTYRLVVIRGRWIVLGAWVVIIAGLTLLVPSGGSGGGEDIGDLLPPGSPAVIVQLRSLAQFAVPVVSQTSVVVHHEGGLDPMTQADVALWALAHVQAMQRGAVPPGSNQIIAAVPIPTSAPDTAVTYLYMSEGTGLDEAVTLADRYAAHFHNQRSVQTFVTGLGPAQSQQGAYLRDWIGVFEVATLVLIGVLVAIVFQSLVAPLAVLFVAGLAYLVSLKLLGLLAGALGFALPDQLTPLLAALLLGVVTDYCVLFFFAFRDQLLAGRGRLDGAERATRSEGVIIAVAGLTVAVGTAALLSANFQLFRAFGPAMSLTVLIGLGVSLTLVPALMAVIGGWLFFPGTLLRDPQHGRQGPKPNRLLLAVTQPRGAAVATAAGISVLLLLALPVANLRLDLSFTSALPSDDEVQQGAQVLSGSVIRGITAPTEVLVEGPDVSEQRAALSRLQALVESQPGVAAVIGPDQNPLPESYGVVYSKSGDAARLIVIFDSDPLGSDSIATLASLNRILPALAAQAGIQGATLVSTGQTAIAAELADITRENLIIILIVALLVELIILMLYLRAVLAPLILLACSALGVGAALGLAVIVFQGIADEPGLAFYVPFATAVLLLALGSDYNVFTVGSIWKHADRYPFRRAIRLAMPATSRAVTSAGVILAASFAMVAVIPLGTFRQIAFIMAVGLLMDTFIIRPILTPAVLTLLGAKAGWPGRRIWTAPDDSDRLVETTEQQDIRR